MLSTVNTGRGEVTVAVIVAVPPPQTLGVVVATVNTGLALTVTGTFTEATQPKGLPEAVSV